MPILASVEDEIHRIRKPEIKCNSYDTDETTLLKTIDGSDRSRIEEMKYNLYPIDETKLPVFEIGVNSTTADERRPISNLIDTTRSVRKTDTKQKEEDTFRIGSINPNEIQMKQETPNVSEENVRHDKEKSDLQKTAQDLLKQKEEELASKKEELKERDEYIKQLEGKLRQAEGSKQKEIEERVQLTKEEELQKKGVLFNAVRKRIDEE